MIPDETILDLIRALSGLWISIILIMIVWGLFFKWCQWVDNRDMKRKRESYPSAVDVKLHPRFEALAEDEQHSYQ